MARLLRSLGSTAALLALGAGFALAPGCAAPQRACANTAACGEGKLCMAGHCRPEKQVPTRTSAQRVVLHPLSVALVSAAQRQTSALAVVPFGKETLGQTVLLLRFPAPFSDSTQILAAHVVMDPAPGAIAGPAPVELRIVRILEPWTPQDTAWANLPLLSPVESTAFASIWGNRPLRLDVTEQVRRWREHRRDDHGLAVLASPQNTVGATYSLGLAGGDGPRLDVYLR